MSVESLSNVPRLNERRSGIETRDSLYALYNEQELARLGARLLLSGLVIPDEADQPIHVMVAQQQNPGVRLVRDQIGNYTVYHDPTQLIVATTEGAMEHRTVMARGKYFGSIDNSYDIFKEHLAIDFTYNPNGETGNIRFNLGSGEGILTKGGVVLGAVMSVLPIHGAVAS